jgi:hypothetical protein
VERCERKKADPVFTIHGFTFKHFHFSTFSLYDSVFVPHSGQNFAPGASSNWQFEHFAFSCVDPHSEQNFAPSRRLAPHFTQGTCATSIFPPQSAQNFAPAAFA